MGRVSLFFLVLWFFFYALFALSNITFAFQPYLLGIVAALIVIAVAYEVFRPKSAP